MATSSFGKAFKAARDAGETEFEFPPNSGKMFNTKYKEEVKTSDKPAAAKSAAPAKDTSNYSNEGRGSSAPAKSSVIPETYRDLSGKVKVKEKVIPPSEYEPGPQNIKRNLLNAPSDIASGLKTAGSAVGDYLGKTFTMEGREKTEKERKERLGMKRGGSVKKMASGGNVSSASKRADGIAQKGKTRGKMC
jgi:hypothetical protein